MRRSRETQGAESSLDSGVGVRGSPCLAKPPGSGEFDLFCFHKTHLTRWMPVCFRREKENGGRVLYGSGGRKKDRVGRKKSWGWKIVAERLLGTFYVPTLNLSSCTINSFNPHSSPMRQV